MNQSKFTIKRAIYHKKLVSQRKRRLVLYSETRAINMTKTTELRFYTDSTYKQQFIFFDKINRPKRAEIHANSTYVDFDAKGV